MSNLIPIADVLFDAEVFTDGDWIETKDQDPDGDVRLTQLADVGDGKWINKSARFLTSEKAKQLKCTYLRSGDLLVARMPDPLGRCCVFPGDSMPCVTVVDVCVIRPNQHRVDNKYLMHVINAPHGRRGIARHMTGTTRRRVSRKNLSKVEIPVPPLAEQKRITGILDAADALRAKRREALAHLDTLIQSTFLDMFGDPVTNPMGWEEEHLPNLVSKRKHSLKRGPFGGALKKEIFVPEGFKVYEQRNVIYNDFNAGSYFVKKSDYERLIAFKVLPNDLLISCSGTIGRIAAVSVDAAPGIMNQALLKITLDESRMLNTFFLGLWRSQPFEQQVLGMTHGTGIKNMKSMNELKSIKFLAPPVGFQRRFAVIAESVEHQKASQRAHLAELDTLFASLQSRAFRGDL